MRYIGNKERLLNSIHLILKNNNIQGNTFFDFFSGTTSVARYYKKLGYKVFSSDIMFLSYCLQKAYIKNNELPLFKKLLDTLPSIQYTSLIISPLEKVINYLNTITPISGFIYNNYTPEGTNNLEKSRMYFTSENGKIIDAIRIQIEEWKNCNLLLENEYYILLSCLIETVSFYANIAGVYAAYQKKWDPRALEKLILKPIEIITHNKEKNVAYHTNSLKLVPNIDVDILYLDPPYNERQYLPNYHLLETIAKYDNPNIKGITEIREYKNEKSSFCNAKTALEGLEYIASNANYKFLVLSYNSEGIMKQSDIISLLSKYGVVNLLQFENLRFKSNNNGLSKTKKHIFEQVYILKK